MPSARWISTLAATALLVACVHEPPPQNVVWVVADTLRADHVSVYGYERETTPRLESFAADAFVVETAIAQAPWTKPSVASMLSGLYPHAHGATSGKAENHLSQAVLTLPEHLAELGFQTVAFSENPHIQPALGFDQGFEQFEARLDRGERPDAAATVDKVLEWMTGRDPERRFFLYLHLLDPHAPLTPPDEFRAAFVEEGLEAHKWAFNGRAGKYLRREGGLELLAGENLEFLLRLYDAEILYIDAMIGRLLDVIDAEPLREKTLVVVTSDHGEEFLDHGILKHGFHLYDETVRVPLLLRVPGLLGGVLDAAAVEHVDLAPTLLELLRLPPLPDAQGESLAAHLWGAPLEPRAAYSETSLRAREVRSLRTLDWKLILRPETQEVELYDLRTDPGETRDVAAEHPEWVTTLRRELAERARSGPRLALGDRVGEADPELQRLLEQLGYTDD